MATCITCRSDNAEEYKASFGGTIVVCRSCNPIVDVVVASLTEDCASAALVFARNVRRFGIRVECDTRSVKIKKKFELASKRGAYYIAIFGAEEMVRSVVQLKDLDAKPSDPAKQMELSTAAALCFLEYMLVPGGRVSGRITPQRIIEVNK